MRPVANFLDLQCTPGFGLAEKVLLGAYITVHMFCHILSTRLACIQAELIKLWDAMNKVIFTVFHSNMMLSLRLTGRHVQ